MSSSNSSSSSTPPEEDTPTRRPPEIDQFVDHFLALMCDRSRRQILELLAVPPNNEDSTLPERRSTDIAKELGLSPATTSGHLKQLRSEEHTSELQSRPHLVCRLLLGKKKKDLRRRPARVSCERHAQLA